MRLALSHVVFAGVALLIAGAAEAADLRVLSAELDTRKAFVGQPVQLLVRLANDSPAEIGPVEVTVVPKSLAAAKETFAISAVTLQDREIEIRPTQPGSFSVRVRVLLGGRLS